MLYIRDSFGGNDQENATSANGKMEDEKTLEQGEVLCVT